MSKRVELDELEYEGYYTYEGIPFTGVAYELYDDGQIMSETAMTGGVEDGLQVEYYENGQIKSKLTKHNDWIHGYVTEWYEDGKIKMKSLIEYGIVVWQQQFDEGGQMDYVFEMDTSSEQYEKLKAFREKKNWKIRCDEVLDK